MRFKIGGVKRLNENESNAPNFPEDPVLEEVRKNIGKWGVYYLIESGKVDGHKESIEKWIEECRSITIRLYMAGKND